MAGENSNLGLVFQKIFTGAIALLTFLFILSLFRNVGKIKQFEKLAREKEERIKKLETKNEEIKKKLEEVGSEAYIEKKLRDDLGLAKEDEIVYILPEASVLESFVPVLSEDEEALPDPNWKKWLKLFDVPI